MGMDVPLPTPRSPRYWSLDLWRGLACLAVVVFHSVSYFQPDGSVRDETIRQFLNRFAAGVPIFFVISGYCIGATADSTRRRGSIAQYFVRRLRRIFPPYWVCLLLTVAVVGFTGWAYNPELFGDGFYAIPDDPATGLSASQWFGNFTLTETWRRHLFGTTSQNLFLAPAWTLCYEEQFYLVCGLLLFTGKRFFTGAALVTAGCLAVAGARCVFKGLPLDGFFFDGRWLMFAAGLAVYYLLNYASPFSFRLLTALLCVAFVSALSLRLSGWASFVPDKAKEEYLFAFGFALLLLGLQRWDRILYDAALLRPVRWCGVMCYSLYLVHFPITKAVSHALAMQGYTSLAPTLSLCIPLCMALSLLVAWGFYHGVERRFLNGPLAARPRETLEAVSGNKAESTTISRVCA